jgi:hypothetical protein
LNHISYLAPPVIQSELEKNLAEAKRLDRNDEIVVRVASQITVGPAAVQTPAKIMTNNLGNPMIITTKKPSSFSFDSISNLLTSGFAAVGQISNAVGNYYSKTKIKLFYK